MTELPLRTLSLAPRLNLQPHLAGMQAVSFSLGPDGSLYVLAVVPPLDYRENRPGGNFAKIQPAAPNTFAVLRWDGASMARIDLSPQSWNFHTVQPLPGGELLLVCGRSRYRGPDDYDLNGHVFGPDGRFRRSFLLGDGIEDVQATSDGRIWVSYFDEGIFGNFGWNDPIGSSGLICWDAQGRALHKYAPQPPLHHMADCYALNVATGRDTWFYYYTEFPLVHMVDERVAGHWECPVAGAHHFAVDGDHVLMAGGYEDKKAFHLFELQAGGVMIEAARVAFTDPRGAPLDAQVVTARGPYLVLLSDFDVYRVSVGEVV